MGRGQVVRHQVLVLAFGGSNPSAPAITLAMSQRLVGKVIISACGMRTGSSVNFRGTLRDSSSKANPSAPAKLLSIMSAEIPQYNLVESEEDFPGSSRYLFCHGTDDLFGLVARPIPAFRTPQLMEVFRKRLEEKRWRERWPHLKTEEVN